MCEGHGRILGGKGPLGKSATFAWVNTRVYEGKGATARYAEMRTPSATALPTPGAGRKVAVRC